MTDNADREEQGKQNSIKGFANESRLLAALLERGHNASRVELPHSPYDIVVIQSTHDLIRVQVKTVDPQKSVSFTGGGRGGQDRIYIPGVKEYVHDTQTCDIIVGVESIPVNGDSEINFYFIPTSLVEILKQKSLSVNLIPEAKNDWDILFRCKEPDFVIETFDALLVKKGKKSAAEQMVLELN